MKTPTVEQLQAWTQQWDEAKRFHSIQKVLDRQQAKAQDHQAQSIPKALGFEVVAGEQIATLRNELGRALRDLGLEPPWSARNSKSGLYRTDEHVIPLAIRLLDGLRLSKASRYADFAEGGHTYGCKSPFTDSHLAVNTDLKDTITNPQNDLVDWLYRQALSKRVEMTEYVDELTSRLFNLNVDIMQIPAEKRDDIKNSLYKDVSTLMARTAGDTLATVDENMTETTTRLVDRLMESYFSTWREELTGGQNVVLQTTIRSKIEQVFRQFNQEKNAERHLSDCFDVAFCAKASESDQSATHLQDLNWRNRYSRSSVLRGASVNSAQSLYAFESYGRRGLIGVARRAVQISSYGLLKATLDEMNTRNMDFADDDWIDMTKDALKGCEPSIIKQCLHIKDKSGKSLLEGCRENQQFVLLREAISADKLEHSMRSNEDRLQMILDTGVNVNAKGMFGLTALMRACELGHDNVVTQLIEARADVNVGDTGGQTPLMTACSQGHEGIVLKLIEARAEVNATNNIGETALMCACYNGHGEIVTQLIDAQAEVDAVSTDTGQTALMYACEYGKEAIATKLIEAKAEVNAVTTDNGKTALIHACYRRDGEIVTQLIEAGAEVSAKDRNGDTALMAACKVGADNIVSRLLEAGADVNAKDSKGNTAYDYAVDRGHAGLANRVIALESVGTRANRIVIKTATTLFILTALAGFTTATAGMMSAALYGPGPLDTALESASQAVPDIVSTATNVTSQALTELTTAAIEIGRQMGYGPSL